MKSSNLILEEADYFIKNQATIRTTAKYFNVGKTTIHKDLTERLKKINPEKYQKVSALLKKHLQIRHINGGLATKLKYRN